MNKCCICCPVMDARDHIDKILCNMEKIGNTFSEYKILLFIDEKDHDTMNVIMKHMGINKNIYLFCSYSKASKKELSHRLADARNYLLDHIRAKYNDYQYFVMMDSDKTTSRPINMNVWKETIKKKDWDGLTFNSDIPNIWAFSPRDLVFGVWHFQQPTTNELYHSRYNELVNTKTHKTKLIDVTSAFNGIAIYRSSFLESKYYPVLQKDFIPPYMKDRTIQSIGPLRDYFWKKKNEKDQDSEHRSFHHYMVFKYGTSVRISTDHLFVNEKKN